MSINFISSKDSEETRIMYTKGHNTEIMIGNETVEIIEKLFESLLQNYQKDLEESMKESEFIFWLYWFIVFSRFKNRFENRRIIYRFSWMIEK